MSAASTVKGLKWGTYVGSPDCPDPIVVWSAKHLYSCPNLCALPSKEVFALKANSCLLVMHKPSANETGRRIKKLTSVDYMVNLA